MIFCSEKCLHEEEGLCTITEVTHTSGTPIKDCPYYKSKASKKEDFQSHNTLKD